jgi:hypothetical protein
MTDLSPAAQAVLDEAMEFSGPAFESLVRKMLAASLRVVAEQIRMDKPLGSTDADEGVYAAHYAIRTQILITAYELEGVSD